MKKSPARFRLYGNGRGIFEQTEGKSQTEKKIQAYIFNFNYIFQSAGLLFICEEELFFSGLVRADFLEERKRLFQNSLGVGYSI